MDKEKGQAVVALGADHAGYELKTTVSEYLRSKGIVCRDFGTDSGESCDYPDYAFRVAKAVSEGECSDGILICGTGIGMSIVANKLSGVRAALCTSVEMARISRQHNNANIICLGARLADTDSHSDILEAWFSSEFERGRHERRVAKIHSLTGV